MGIKHRINRKKCQEEEEDQEHQVTVEVLLGPHPQQKHKPQLKPQQNKEGMMSGLMGTMMQGMAFGAGSEIAHTAMRSVMGGSGTQEQQQQPEQTQQTQQNTNQCQN